MDNATYKTTALTLVFKSHPPVSQMNRTREICGKKVKVIGQESKYWFIAENH
jgi:hypothetical protein